MCCRLLDQLAGNALRLLACAVKTDLGDLAGYDGSESHPAHKLLADPSNYPSIESNMVFLGVAGLQDPPRPEVRRAGGVRSMLWSVCQCQPCSWERGVEPRCSANLGSRCLPVQVKLAIQDCTHAGIRVVVITGDNKLTAEAICRKIGVFDEDAPLDKRSMTGMEFAALPEGEKIEFLSQKVGLSLLLGRTDRFLDTE